MAVLLLSFMGGAAWLSHAVSRAYAQGSAAGRADVLRAVDAESARQRAAAEAALAVTNAQVADLERARDQLQESYDALLAQSAGDSASGGLCLGVGVVRALDAIGRDVGSAGARP